MELTHWKKLNNPNYLGSFSLLPNEEKVLTIKSAGKEQVIGADGKKEECIVAHFVEKELPMIINATNAKTIERLYKTPYVEQWAGKKIQVYSTTVRAFGEDVEALRIRPFPPRAKEYFCEVCGKQIQPFGKMTAEQYANLSMQRKGKVICPECGKTLADGKKAAQNEPNTAEPTKDVTEE